MQGRRNGAIFWGNFDFSGMGRFAQALKKAEEAQLQTLPLDRAALQVQKQSGHRVPLFVWNDRAHLPCEDRADLILRLCFSETEATIRADDPRDAALAASMAQLLEQNLM